MTSSYNLIVPHLYLGDYASADNSLLLDKLGVTALVSIDYAPPCSSLPQLAIQILDKEDEDLLSELPSITEFISKEIVSGGTIFVHCFHGVSRSASAVIAYLMKTKEISLHESLSLVKAQRPSIEPNPGFMKQLQLYSMMNCTLQLDNDQFRLYKFLHEDPIVRSAKSKQYKCKKCNNIFNLSVFPHTPSQKLDWSVKPKVSTSFSCNLGLFIEGIEANLLEGDKIKCPKCLNKLGRFSTNRDIFCPCGTSLIPGYWINTSQVDPFKKLDLNLLR